MVKIQLIGNVTNDPSFRTVREDLDIAEFRIAADTNKGKNKKTMFVNCTAFRGLASIVSQFVRKGDKIYVDGVPQVDKFTTKAGVEVETFSVNIDSLELLGGGNKRQQSEVEHDEEPENQEEAVRRPAKKVPAKKSVASQNNNEDENSDPFSDDEVPF